VSTTPAATLRLARSATPQESQLYLKPSKKVSYNRTSLLTTRIQLTTCAGLPEKVEKIVPNKLHDTSGAKFSDGSIGK